MPPFCALKWPSNAQLIPDLTEVLDLEASALPSSEMTSATQVGRMKGLAHTLSSLFSQFAPQYLSFMAVYHMVIWTKIVVGVALGKVPNHS